MRHINAWTTYDKKTLKKVNDFAEDYRVFLSENKTERECASTIVEMAKKAGYISLEEAYKNKTKLKPGDKVWVCHHKKLVFLAHIGKNSLVENGANILGAHIDAPRFDIKQNPTFQSAGIVLFETHFYGGIYMYQWVNIPMALKGVIAKKDGTVVEVNIGDKPGDPVMFLNDLLIHLSYKSVEKPAKNFIDPEKVDLLVGSRPLVKDLDVKKGQKSDAYDFDKAADPNSCVSCAGNQAITQYLLKLLNDNYGVTDEDLESAELEVVPAGDAKDCGIDSSMICGHGQDDRACAFPSTAAQLSLKDPEKTCISIFTDKEEIGSVGATGMSSKVFENSISEILELTGQDGCFINTRRALAASTMISSDVSGAFDPSHPEVFEEKNSCFMGDGLVFNKYGGSGGKRMSNDASAEFCAKIRECMDNAGVITQTAELGAVGAGGGGTIAFIPAEFGMDVIDCGVSVLSMHCPWEVISKADLYEAYKGYSAFLKNYR